MHDIVNKINILLQEICGIKVQKNKKQHINDHRTHPRDTDGIHGQDNKYSCYSNASSHLSLDTANILAVRITLILTPKQIQLALIVRT